MIINSVLQRTTTEGTFLLCHMLPCKNVFGLDQLPHRTSWSHTECVCCSRTLEQSFPVLSHHGAFLLYLYPSLQHQVFQVEKQRLAVLSQVRDNIIRVQFWQLFTGRPLLKDVDTHLQTTTNKKALPLHSKHCARKLRRKHAEYKVLNDPQYTLIYIYI